MTATKTVLLDGLRFAYRELGAGPPVLLLHGWPTSSFLWREVMVPIARANRVVALDLPGFGASDKPAGIRYSFDFFGRALDLFLAHLAIEQLGLAVHDLGGPVGLHWALHRPGRLTKLALLNTLVYPEFSEAVKEFVRACAAPELRDKITSPSGLESIMRDGLADPATLSAEVLAAVQEPFRTAEARRALADAGIGRARGSRRSRASSRRSASPSAWCTAPGIECFPMLRTRWPGRRSTCPTRRSPFCRTVATSSRRKPPRRSASCSRASSRAD